MTLRNIFFGLNILFLSACNQIETGQTLSKTDITRIQSYYPFDKDEKIQKFYSESKPEVAGNFFTNKRIAKYWIDKNDNSKTEISFALYKDIRSIDTVYYAGATYCPYMLVTKKDSSKFKVCVEGTKKEIKDFFDNALTIWIKNK